jgi:predicted DNA binding CopG/RHH family protein
MKMNNEELNELRDYYDNIDVASEFTNTELDTRTTDEVMVSTSIRLPQSLVDKVRTQAAALGIPASTLMRQWDNPIAERCGFGRRTRAVHCGAQPTNRLLI